MKESTTSRIMQHIAEDENWAIVSPYRSEYSESENRQRLLKLKSEVRGLGFGYIELLSRWVENGESFDERSLFIPKMDVNTALKLGHSYEQASVIVKNKEDCEEICTNPFETYNQGETVRKFNISLDRPLNIGDAQAIFARRKGGPASKPVKGGDAFQLQEVLEIESPRPSYFNNSDKVIAVLYRNDME